MGEVFKAQHRYLKTLAAVKILPQSAFDSTDGVERFHKEIKVASRLDHPHVVRTHDAGVDKGMYYLVMEYIAGTNLAALVGQQGPLPIELAVEYTVQTARGLQYAHDNGVIHRDIKPSNLMVNVNGVIKILDMGLAHAREAVENTASTIAVRLTQLGQVLGTFSHMAPEQAIDTINADHRADIYSLGCTLYHLIASRPPYHGATPVHVMTAHREAAIPYLRDVNPNVSAQLDTIFQKMVAKKPAYRHQSMTEVIAELETAVLTTGSMAPTKRTEVPPMESDSADSVDYFPTVPDSDVDRSENLSSVDYFPTVPDSDP